MPAMSSTSSAASRVLLGALLALALLILPACHLPTPLKELDEPRLETVQRDYQNVVHFAFNHPHEDWYHGWYGNFWRNWHRGNRRGLCYEWQAVVYEGVRESAPAAGFVAIGIMKDRDQSTEHHAVLLFEKGDIVSSTQGKSIGPDAGRILLDQREPRRAWVLDAWRYGRADIFTLDDWLGAPHHWKGRIEFEDLEAEFQARIHKEEMKRIEAVSDERSAQTGV